MENQFSSQFTAAHNDLAVAQKWDREDELNRFREEFVFPKTEDGRNQLYFTGHSLGLMPKKAKDYINAELESWGQYAVEGHFKGKHPWLPYHEFLTPGLARLVGAKENEVVAMNSLTVNLHLLLISFYRPQAKRYKILIENNTFPSDKYAVDSQVKMHGFTPADAIVELKPRAGEITVRQEDILEQIQKLGDSLAVVMLGNCNYLSGQKFDFKSITEAAHKVGAYCGFNLAHGAGNLYLELHNWNVDFAVWCSYKYLNAGPGGIAGAFVHETHHQHTDWPRLAGWWGHDKQSRFKMGPQFSPIPTVEAWQLSNPPIFQLASLRASIELFDSATMKALSKKSNKLTGYLYWLLSSELKNYLIILTPADNRGAMLCLRFKKSPRDLAQKLMTLGIVVDFREPDIIRAAPAPLYNSYEDVFTFVKALKELVNE